MKKFKIYRGIAFLTLVLSILTFLLPLLIPVHSIYIVSIITMCVGVLFFVCYILLVSIFNFYHEPWWKKFAIWFFIIGIVIFNLTVAAKYYSLQIINIVLLVFYLPMVIAFATLKHEKIKPFALLFACTSFIVCLIRIALPFIRNSMKIDVSAYNDALNIVFRLPMVFILALFHKMISISKENIDDEAKTEYDLL